MHDQDIFDPDAVEAPPSTQGAPVDVVAFDDAGEHQRFSTDECYLTWFDSDAEANSCDPCVGAVVISRTACDRAAVVTVAIEQICATAQGRERWQAVEDYLREEIADIERQIAADRRTGDA